MPRKTAFERLQEDAGTQQWWQAVLNDPRFGLIESALIERLARPRDWPPTQAAAALGAEHAGVIAITQVSTVNRVLDELAGYGIESLGDKLAEEKVRAEKQQRLNDPRNAHRPPRLDSEKVP